MNQILQPCLDFVLSKTVPFQVKKLQLGNLTIRGALSTKNFEKGQVLFEEKPFLQTPELKPQNAKETKSKITPAIKEYYTSSNKQSKTFLENFLSTSPMKTYVERAIERSTQPYFNSPNLWYQFMLSGQLFGRMMIEHDRVKYLHYVDSLQSQNLGNTVPKNWAKDLELLCEAAQQTKGMLDPAAFLERNELFEPHQPNIKKTADRFWLSCFGKAIVNTIFVGRRYSLFLASSFINHSCQPNLKIQSSNGIGDSIQFKSTKKIMKGDHLCFDYLGGIYQDDTNMRKQLIRLIWGFDCLCDLCRKPK
ncbi:set and mynd domain-containing protein [Anaeramoeba flamelloides]|uniref:Set and mynd domain-containing protein n=1 Tax=Anaeramoeba flamelloides TaxID=1746091 RepID=A0AAV7Z795_9EUKA|nr:set and mynd domain-containing protein [Anaeramoeba flamelloides]